MKGFHWAFRRKRRPQADSFMRWLDSSIMLDSPADYGSTAADAPKQSMTKATYACSWPAPVK
jgi:hypothetical protein